jgi:hypothetical protein
MKYHVLSFVLGIVVCALAFLLFSGGLNGGPSPDFPPASEMMGAEKPSGAKAIAAPRPSADEASDQGDRATAGDQIRKLKAQIQELTAAGVDAESRLAVRNQQLEEEVKALRSELQTEKEIRTQNEGKKVPFPEDLPEEYQSEGLMKAFGEVFNAAGVEGEITAMDCSEFPCIVHGEFSANDDQGDGPGKRATAFFQGLEVPYPNDQHNKSVAHSISETKNDEGATERKNHFSVAIMPNDHGPEDSKQRSDMHKRVGLRTRQYMESMRGN